MSDMCSTIVDVISGSNDLINHIHICGELSNKFSAKLIDALSYTKIKLRLFNCLEYSADDIISELEKEDGRIKSKLVFILLGIDHICEGTRSCKESLKLLFKKNQRSTNTKLLTYSNLSWSCIQSNYLRTIISSPIQFSDFENSNDENANKMASMISLKLGVTETFVSYVLLVMDIHYKKPRLLLHVVKKIADECAERGISLVGKISMNNFTQIGAICKEYTMHDKAFSLNKISTNKSEISTSQFPVLTKCAIIAVYCASYNPAYSDQIFFFKVTILLETGIVQMLSAAENIDEPKYRCLCPYSLADNVAKSLDVELKKHLFDFASEV